jgi:hypothetical protein
MTKGCDGYSVCEGSRQGCRNGKFTGFHDILPWMIRLCYFSKKAAVPAMQFRHIRHLETKHLILHSYFH